MRELLTPDEIAALTQAFATDAPVAEPSPPAGVRPLDLANQERSLEGRLPGLELVVGRFARGLRSAIAASLGDVPTVRTATLGLVRFGRLSARLAEPSGLVRFRMAPLRGQGILTIPSPLVAALLQVSCGGAARQIAALPARELSPVELRFIERLAVRLLAELGAAWAPIASVQCTLVQVETTPLFATIAAPDDLVVHAELSIALAGVAPSTLTLVVPNAALDQVRARLQTMRASESAVTPPDARWASELQERLLDVPVEVAVDLGGAELTVSRLLDLAVGDVVTLDVGRDGPAVVRVAGEPRFQGVPGLQGGNNAVRITARR